MKKVIVVVVLISSLLVAEDFFVIGAYVVNKQHLATAHDSLKLNTVTNSWLKNQDSIDLYLDEAASETLNVILSQAAPSSGRRFGFYCNLWHALWESEDTMFCHDNTIEGKAIQDLEASNDTAWVCSVGVDQEGLMQTGRELWQLRINTHEWHASWVEYTAMFRLKIDTTSLDDTVKVCSLAIYSPEDYHDTIPGVQDSIFNDTILTIGDFHEQNVYEICSLTFKKDSISHDLIWYRVYWYGNITLWSDYVEVKDEHIDSLTEGVLDDSLRTICQHYAGEPALYRYYLWDEPRFGHFAASAHIRRFLDLEFSSTPGIQTLGGANKPYFELYADSVNPEILWFDYYPFYGDSGSNGRVPEDCGPKFQAYLDTLCLKLGDMRMVALDKNKDFWYAPQAFGKYIVDSLDPLGNPDEGGDEGRWRLPTRRELRCNTWLGITYGAKGIMYWLHDTYDTYEAGYPEWMRGLWRYDNTPREPLFSEAREINKTLEKIGPALLALTSDTVFVHKGSNPPPETPSNCFIDYISDDDTVQVGTFHADSDSFFIIVNRLCQESDTDTVLVRIKRDSIFLHDLYTGEAIPPDTEFLGNANFSFLLPPGQGRCFQLVPFAQDFRTNNNHPYSNMRFAALNTKAWSSKSIDSMNISQSYFVPPDTLADYTDSTGWIAYDTAYCWYLRQEGERLNKISIQYKVADSIMTPKYFDKIMFDSTAPTGSFVIDDDSTFTNSSGVTLQN